MQTTNKGDKAMIKDNETLTGCKDRFGYDIPIYDDWFGQLYIMRNSTGIMGIVRAQSWEDAYGICEDEFFPECDLTMEEIVKEYGFKRYHIKIIHPVTVKDGIAYIHGNEERPDTPEDYAFNGALHHNQFVRWETKETPDPEAWMENALFQEAYGFRPNGPNGKDKLCHGIYAKDLSGESLDKLTAAMVLDLGLNLIITEEE
jgi:hypothetical protein